MWRQSVPTVAHPAARLRATKPWISLSTLARWGLDSLASGIVAALMALFMVHTVGFALDDSYITYRYAKHLELGYGLVFNVGEPYLGTTAAGFAILLALTHRLIDLLHVADLLAA